MKNKTFISFLVNILVGILFSFPVFSAQGNTELYVNSHKHHYVSASQIETFHIADNNFYSEIHFRNYNLSDVLPSKLFINNLTTDNKDITFFDFSTQILKDHYREYYLPYIFFKNPDFVNLSYLKELKTTKMLC